MYKNRILIEFEYGGVAARYGPSAPRGNGIRIIYDSTRALVAYTKYSKKSLSEAAVW